MSKTQPKQASHFRNENLASVSLDFCPLHRNLIFPQKHGSSWYPLFKMVSENGDILWIRQKIAIFNNIYLPENPFILIISLLLPLMSTIQEQGKEGIQKVDRVVFWKLKLLLQLHKSYITRFAQWQVLRKRFYRHSCFKTNQGRKLIYN